MIEPHLEFKRLKRTVTIQRVLVAVGLIATLRRRGNRLVGPCPLHDGDNPRAFVVDLEKDLWFCFSRCGGGDVVELARQLGHSDYSEAAEFLASVAAARTEPFPPPSFATSTPLPPTNAFRPYTRRLHLDPNACFLRAKGIHPATASRFEAGAYHGSGFCAGCVAVRLHDVEGRPLGYAARRLDDQQARRHGKWKLPPRLPKRDLLYGFHRCARALVGVGVVVVEGPWAVMRLAQVRVPAVALLGVHLSEPQRRLLVSASRVVLMLDGDPAGRQASGRIHQLLAPATDVTDVLLSDGVDPDDLPDDQLLARVRPLRLP
jgi:DNA primase